MVTFKLRRLLKPFILVLALMLIFEEWLWDSLKRQLHRLSGLPLVQRAENVLQKLPPWASLLVMALPGLVLLPFKLAGLWAIGNGHPVLGFAIFVMAKISGTALAAYLFDLVRDSARKMGWFDRVYLCVMSLLARAKQWLYAQVVVQAARSTVERWKAALRVWIKSGKRSAWTRRLAAVRAGRRKA